MYIYVEVEIMEFSRFLDFLFISWQQRWFFLIDMNFGRCLWLMIRLYQAKIWNDCAWLIKVMWIWLVWRMLHVERLKDLLFLFRREITTSNIFKDVGEYVLDAIVIFQRPLVQWVFRIWFFLHGICWRLQYNFRHRIYQRKLGNRWWGCLENVIFLGTCR